MLDDILRAVPLDNCLFQLAFCLSLGVDRAGQIWKRDVSALGHPRRFRRLSPRALEFADLDLQHVVLADTVVAGRIGEIFLSRLHRAHEFRLGLFDLGIDIVKDWQQQAFLPIPTHFAGVDEGFDFQGVESRTATGSCNKEGTEAAAHPAERS